MYSCEKKKKSVKKTVIKHAKKKSFCGDEINTMEQWRHYEVNGTLCTPRTAGHLQESQMLGHVFITFPKLPKDRESHSEYKVTGEQKTVGAHFKNGNCTAHERKLVFPSVWISECTSDTTRGLRWVILLYSALAKPHFETCVQCPVLALHHKRNMNILQRVQTQAMKTMMGQEHISHKESLRELWLLSSHFWRAEGSRGPDQCKAPKGRVQKE